MELLQIYSEDDLNSLPSGVWGIKEPDRLHNGQRRASGMIESFYLNCIEIYCLSLLIANDTGLDLILVPGALHAFQLLSYL
jgi:5-formyltetrahydrofolate cyclo-ligase